MHAMRIAPQHASITPGSDVSSPAQDYVRQAQWLLDPKSVVRDLQVVDAHTVRLVVLDPFVTDPADREEADRLAADSALVVLEQAAHGVQLITETESGYRGKVRDFTPAQLTFTTGLPHVQRYDLVPEDLNGDGHLAPEEVAHRVEVDSPQDAAHIDWLLRDRLDEHGIQPGPVRVVVPVSPFRPGNA
ncbi:MAG: hypothetical protein JWL76_1709 [Thermoleophilia bacterium]|nr:hypothetical protein [Thermoleophilia bacterium]